MLGQEKEKNTDFKKKGKKHRDDKEIEEIARFQELEARGMKRDYVIRDDKENLTARQKPTRFTSSEEKFFNKDIQKVITNLKEIADYAHRAKEDSSLENLNYLTKRILDRINRIVMLYYHNANSIGSFPAAVVKANRQKLSEKLREAQAAMHEYFPELSKVVKPIFECYLREFQKESSPLTGWSSLWVTPSAPTPLPPFQPALYYYVELLKSAAKSPSLSNKLTLEGIHVELLITVRKEIDYINCLTDSRKESLGAALITLLRQTQDNLEGTLRDQREHKLPSPTTDITDVIGSIEQLLKELDSISHEERSRCIIS